MSLLEVKEITSGYGEVQILWGSTMYLEKGKLTCLVGGNGRPTRRDGDGAALLIVRLPVG